MDGAKLVATPMSKGTVQLKGNEPHALDESVPYREAVRTLLSLSRTTQPDISYSVNQVATHCAAPKVAHWTMLKHMLRYLIGTKATTLTYGYNKEVPAVVVYTDANWANDIEMRRSISGAIMFVHECSVS